MKKTETKRARRIRLRTYQETAMYICKLRVYCKSRLRCITSLYGVVGRAMVWCNAPVHIRF